MNVKFTRDHLSHKRGETAEVHEAYAARVIGQGYAVPVKGKSSIPKRGTKELLPPPAGGTSLKREAKPTKVVEA